MTGVGIQSLCPVIARRRSSAEAIRSRWRRLLRTPALARLEEVVREQCPRTSDARLAVMHAGVVEEARILATSLQSWWGGGEVPIYELPPAIVTHGGPGTMGVGFFI